MISPSCAKPTQDLGRTNLSPLDPPMVVDRAVDAPRDAAEPPKVGDDGESYEDKDDGLCALGEAAGGEDEVVEQVGGHEDAKVERRKLETQRQSEILIVRRGEERGSAYVVVDVGYATHDHERYFVGW